MGKSNGVNATNENSSLLIKGDISGIQEFIFNVKSKGAAKSLKGRSFFMKILTEITISAIFDLFQVAEELRPEYRISTSGGNFYLKVPKIDDFVSKINELQLGLSKGLFFTGIDVIVQAVELNEEKYKECLEELNHKIRLRKLMIYPINNELDFGYLFQPNYKLLYEKTEEKPQGNSAWEPITSSLRTKKFMTIKKTDSAQVTLTLKTDSLELMGYECKFHNLENDPFKIRLTDYLENIFPMKDEYMQKEFEDLVKREFGDEKLGILKMDVDNLGTTLENIENSKIHHEFDNYLKLFFNNTLNEIIESEFQNKVYTVTAGGDDSFFVGHWRVILELALIINDEFKAVPYFKEKGLTISAGYIIVGTKFPVIRFSQLAEDALHKAKYEYEKGNISIFDEVVNWEMLKEIMRFKRKLRESVDEKSKGLLAKSRQSAIRGIDEEVFSLKENWEIAYYLRNIKEPELVKTIREKIIKSTEITGNTKLEKQRKRSLRLILPIASRLAELEMR